MSLQIPGTRCAFPGAGRDPNLTLLVEPVIYCWGSRKVANSGFALAHHPGSELNVRVPARPYRHMQHTLLKMRRLVKYCGMGRCIFQARSRCGLPSPSVTLVQIWQPCERLISTAAGKGTKFRLGRVFAVLGRPTSPKPADSLFFRPLPTVSGEVGPLEGRLLN